MENSIEEMILKQTAFVLPYGTIGEDVAYILEMNKFIPPISMPLQVLGEKLGKLSNEEKALYTLYRIYRTRLINGDPTETLISSRLKEVGCLLQRSINDRLSEELDDKGADNVTLGDDFCVYIFKPPIQFVVLNPSTGAVMMGGCFMAGEEDEEGEEEEK